MKKFRTIKSKIIMFIFALILPLSATGLVYTFDAMENAKADDNVSSTNYYSGYMKEVSLTNNNFNSSSSTYSISTSLSGWTGQMSDRRTTAGIINNGNTFQNYMSSTYRLAKNPLSKATDKHILMINSKTDDSSDAAKYATARQGYKSSTISLDKNSFYSFQVAFKSDTNYNSYTSYVHFGEISGDTTISKEAFEKVAFGKYVSFTYKSKNYYLLKDLQEDSVASDAIENISVFYEDDEYVGFMKDDTTPVYVSVNDLEKTIISDDETKIDVKANSTLYTCSLVYQKNNSTENYKVLDGTKYYTTKTDYTSLNDYVYGSMYLDGLTDENGDPVEAKYVKVSSKEWETFYFFVATGNKAQSVTLDLWLGANVAGHESSGVVFYDDCHVYQYSENNFWKTYQSYFGKKYSQDITDSNGTTTTHTFDCVNLVDLRNDTKLAYPSHNLDFEEGIYNEDVTSLKNWKKDGSGNAQVFNSKAPQYFKSTTGYDFVGSNLSCTVNIDEEEITLTPNNYVLGLWTKNNNVKVTSNNIDINANEIYKIKAYYKISELTNGNVYLFVEENDTVLSTYNLTKDQYTLKGETASSSVSSNAANDFTNNYGTIEFYVKGGALYNSSINVSLGLGKSDEASTGCVVFDDITIEKATSSDYENATNKTTLDEKTGSLTVPNGNFNKITIDENYKAPYAAENWTVTGGSGLLFDGVIGTESTTYNKYATLFNAYQSNSETADNNNPYYWASYANPTNSQNKTNVPDNVMMLANLNKSWQKLTSENMSLEASATYQLNFKYKTYNTSANTAKFKVSLYSKDGVKLFESQDLTSNGSWSTEGYSMYLKSFAGASEVYIVIDFGTQDNMVEGFAYFDNFELNKVESEVYDNKVNNAEGNGDKFGIVDMTDFFLNIPTNNITEDLNTSTTPAFTGSVSSTDGNHILGGIVKSDKFANEDTLKSFEITKESADEESKNVFFITSQGVGSYTIESNFNIDLKADTYYALSFKLKTAFRYSSNNEELDKKKNYSFGTTFGLTGFDYMTELKSNEDYKTYTMYFNPSEAKSAKLHIAFVCDSNETIGTMALYDIVFEESTEDAYNTAKETASGKHFDINEDRVFVAKADGSTDNDDNKDDDNNNDNTNSEKQSFDWLLIPTLITALAIVIAVVGFFMRKVKIKKIEKKRKETYDRKSSLNIDIIKSKARRQRDAEVEEVKSTIGKFQKELDELEKIHKQKVLNLREKDKGQVSKETDREFKLFAQKRTVIAEKIDSLNKQIEQINSPEYLLNLERKVYAQEEMKQKELSKISKQLNKEKEKKAEVETAETKKPTRTRKSK